MYAEKGSYDFKHEISSDGVKRALKDPQTLENGDLYYGFW